MAGMLPHVDHSPKETRTQLRSPRQEAPPAALPEVPPEAPPELTRRCGFQTEPPDVVVGENLIGIIPASSRRWLYSYARQTFGSRGSGSGASAERESSVS